MQNLLILLIRKIYKGARFIHFNKKMVDKYKGGKIDAKFIAVSSIILVVLLAAFVIAVNTTVQLNGQASNLMYFASNGSNTATNSTIFNFSITATGANGINRTVIQLAAGIQPINGTNGTNAIAYSLITDNNITWNSTAGVGSMINTSQTKYFWVNLTANDGVYNITIWTYDNSSSGLTPANQTNITIVFDSTVPVVMYTAPGIGNNLTSRAIRVNASVNDSWLNKTIITLHYSSNLTAVAGASYTNNTNYATLGIESNLSTSLTVPADGNYTINVTAFDNSGNKRTLYRNVTVDTLGPVATLGATIKSLNITGLVNVSYPAGNVYNSVNGLLTINVTVIDATSTNVSRVWFNITNTAVPNLQNATFNATRDSADVSKWSNSSWNLSKYPEGKYQITVFTYDDLNNSASSELGYVILDRSAPSLLTFTSVTTAQTSLTFNVNVTDVVGMNSTCRIYQTGGFDLTTTSNGSSQDVTESGLTCATSYTYNVNCTDALGNSNLTTSAATYTTSACTAASTSSGGSSSSATSEAVLTGVTKTFNIGTVLGFTLPATATSPATKHTLVVKSIKDAKVTFTVSSTPQTVTMAAGEEKKLNLNNDTILDLYIKVNSVTTNQADITLRAISEAIATETAPTTPATEEKTATEKVADVITSPSNRIWVIVGAVIIVALIVYLIVRARKK